MADSSRWILGIGGNFPLHKAVLNVMPDGTKVVSSESSGVSAWTKTAKVSVILPDGTPTRYFLKIASGRSGRGLAEGEYYSAKAINEVVESLVPVGLGWGEYHNGESMVFFFLGEFHDMDFSTPPEPNNFMAKIAQLHLDGKSPTGQFGFPVPTVFGIFQRTVTWTDSWATCYANLLKDVIGYDNEVNGPWPEYDDACKQLIDHVVPRVLGALQSDGRSIKPALLHGDLWEQNIGIDMESDEPVLFDPGSIYGHNEMEFGTWRCSWAYYFNSPLWMRLYQRHIEPSEPVEEWDDRNRLYSLHPYINDSAGHPGSASRATQVSYFENAQMYPLIDDRAYNDMLFLCEKYAPSDTLEKYDPEKDISVTHSYVQHSTHTMRDAQVGAIK